ncbi:cob(I)yrinic acid a,c-diamide adenosyltransferase [Planctellipticum variicoloris]|uniref:cob(I)yrinic acid a,c-diamide adenosyltransferase n=1 Tax=Planctellipticum variicoloris TaxID=3064265 RepID=UPI003013E54E|nr:cob(I)yrinic acid a,c-diamide adenosyltransferase [Planctomycetaceae bacterium SH412]
MVYLNRIYTKSGDAGETSLGDGRRVPKTHPRIGAYGGVDELNSVLGVAIAAGLPDAMQAMLMHIQNDLFDLGADLCVPESDTPPEYPPLRVTEPQVTQLERWIDAATDQLEPLTSFILPGGSPAAAHLHLARTVCRRVEIGVLDLVARERVNPQAVIYLNRLSDLLFVLARLANDGGKADVLWTPGKHREVASD